MSQDIANAFDARLSTIRVGIDIQYEGVAYAPIAGRPYLSARLSGYSRMNTGPGPDCVMQENGSYQVNVHRPAGEGRRPAGELADKVVRHFPRGLFLPCEGTHTLTIQYASAQPAIYSGDWVTVPVVISWFATDP